MFLGIAMLAVSGCTDAMSLARESDPAVYEAVVGVAFEAYPFGDWKTDEILVLDSTAGYYMEDGFHRTPPHSLPRRMRSELRRVAWKRQSSVVLDLPGNFRIVTATEAEAAMDRMETGTSVFGFSPIVYSRAGDMAAVYYEFDCGGLCGKGSTAVLVRENGTWRVEEEYLQWIS